MSEPSFRLMTRAVLDPIFKKLNAELGRAESSAVSVLSDYQGNPPASLLVVFKQRYEFKSMAYLLYDPANLEISVMVDLREGLRLAASQVAKLGAAEPAYAISMIAIDSAELSFWLKKGFFPTSEVPASFIGKKLLLFTASTASGHVIRRLSELVSSPLLLGEGTRQLGRSVQIQMSHEPSEMDVFWSKHKTVKKQLLENGERRHYL